MKFTDTNKRYHTLDYHLKQKFGGKVVKISLNAGFTCPNIDGTKGVHGCTYCSTNGSGDFGGNPTEPLFEQYNILKSQILHKWNNAKYIAYFQAHTNTYAPVEILKQMFEEVLHYDNVVGISIATRADCLADDVVDYLAELSKRTYLIIELGLQTIHDITGEKINRCHSYADFLVGYNKLYAKNINVCIHIINGLPDETKPMMLESIKAIANLRPHSVKLHLLHILKGTIIAKQFENGEFDMLELEEYVQIICDQIELLPQSVIVQRITGDGDKKQLIAPKWSLNKLVVINEIDKELQRRNTCQGYKADNY